MYWIKNMRNSIKMVNNHHKKCCWKCLHSEYPELDAPLSHLQRLDVVDLEEVEDGRTLLHVLVSTGPVTGVERTLVHFTLTRTGIRLT